MSQALGIAALIARSDLDAKRAITATRNGINATKPLAERRDSSGMGKLAPSPTIIASASHDARKAAITNGMTDLVLGDNEVRGAAITAIAVCAATMKMATAKMTNAVPRLRQSGREKRSAWIIVVYTTMMRETCKTSLHRWCLQALFSARTVGRGLKKQGTAEKEID